MGVINVVDAAAQLEPNLRFSGFRLRVTDLTREMRGVAAFTPGFRDVRRN
jgi:hypothetical protein